MARALLDSEVTGTVVGYDKSTEAVQIFYEESQRVQKASASVPTSLGDSISKDTNITVISLVNEAQCEQVCFGGDENLINLMPKGACVVLTSTVTATWAKRADTTFRASGILFVDCPVSGGPARARQGDLTLIASGEASCLDFAKPVLDALAGEVHVIQGGAGGGSTVKCVHQLLAGVHICAAAEAMAMAAKAGIDVAQLYRIVNGAAGASWMFTDRGKRMLEKDPEVKSALAIFVKDLDIVYAEAKKLMSPIPVATAALQQFISGQSLGFGKLDDSQVVKVYENVTKVPVVGSPESRSSSKSNICVENEYVKVLQKSIQGTDKVSFSSSAKSGFHSMTLRNVLIDVEIAKAPPMSSREAMSAAMHELVWQSEQVRVYKLSIPAGESTEISYPFFHLAISLSNGDVVINVLSGSETSLQWTVNIAAGAVEWNQPVLNRRATNCGETALEQYIVEFR